MQSAVWLQMLASEISEVNIVNPENCYEHAHNQYAKRSTYVDKKKGTLQRVPNLVGSHKCDHSVEGPPIAGQASYELEPWAQSRKGFKCLHLKFLRRMK